jgi:kynureninase
MSPGGVVNPGTLVADAQLARARRLETPVTLLEALATATGPADVRRAVDATVAPALEALRGTAPHEGADPAALRATHADALGLSAEELAFRELYPGLDIGIYACSHSMGIPSIAGPAAALENLAQLATHGIGTWDDGAWVDVMDRYRARCAELVGGSLIEGDVAWFPNVSEALSAVLECIDGGTLVYTRGHFTTGHYIHHAWASRTGGRLVEVPTDADGSVPTERILDALTPDVRVLSISHALFESGWLQDLPALAAGLRARCPDAMLLLDAYQTAGTVPIDAAALGDHVLVTAGGHKQLRASAGAGFLYVPHRWLHRLSPLRTGWWNHAAPFDFEKGPVRRANDATRFRTGTPTIISMCMLLGELSALASSAGGSLRGALARARSVTRGHVAHLVEGGRRRGLDVRGAWDPDRRAAFVCVASPHARRIHAALAPMGYRLDLRPAGHGGDAGILRVSGNAAGFTYELDSVLDAIAAHTPR